MDEGVYFFPLAEVEKFVGSGRLSQEVLEQLYGQKAISLEAQQNFTKGTLSVEDLVRTASRPLEVATALGKQLSPEQLRSKARYVFWELERHFSKGSGVMEFVTVEMHYRDEPPAAGLEERRAAWRAASELMEGFRSRSTVDSRPVVVIGRDLAQRIPGLQVLSGLEERVVIDRGDLSDTLARAAQIGDTVYFYGDPQRGTGLEELAGRSGLSLSFVLRNPGEDPKVALVLRQIFEDLGVPSADISSGLEEFTRRVETLGLAA